METSWSRTRSRRLVAMAAEFVADAHGTAALARKLSQQAYVSALSAFASGPHQHNDAAQFVAEHLVCSKAARRVGPQPKRPRISVGGEAFEIGSIEQSLECETGSWFAACVRYASRSENDAASFQSASVTASHVRYAEAVLAELVFSDSPRMALGEYQRTFRTGNFLYVTVCDKFLEEAGQWLSVRHRRSDNLRAIYEDLSALAQCVPEVSLDALQRRDSRFAESLGATLLTDGSVVVPRVPKKMWKRKVHRDEVGTSAQQFALL